MAAKGAFTVEVSVGFIRFSFPFRFSEVHIERFMTLVSVKTYLKAFVIGNWNIFN